jgi:O-antigen ligase
LLLQRVTDQRDVAVSERWRGYGWSVQIIKSNSVWYGNGLTNYKVELRSFLDSQGISYQPWEIDYAHSVPLMIVAQFGIVGGGALLIIIGWWLLRVLPRESFVAMLALGPALVLDHYFITKPVALMYLLFAVIMIIKINHYKVKSV